MFSKKLTACIGLGVLAGTFFPTLVLATPKPKDYTSLPPEPAEIENQLRSTGITLLDAVKKAQDAVSGIAQVAELLLDEDPPVFEVLVYADGKAYRIRLNPENGEIVENTNVPRFPGAPFTGDWIETESGLKYVVLKEGTGAKPSDKNADVKLNMSGFLVTGEKFVDTYDVGKPIDLRISALPQGMVEALMDMKEGEKRKLIIPFALAFGAHGGQGMPPMATIIMDLELVKIMDYQKIPDELPGEPIGDAPKVTTESGLIYYDLKVGDGEMPSGPDTKVKVHYTGYLNDGTKFDSSVDRGSPAEFTLNQFISGWTEGVGSMRVGGKRKLVIPYNLAYGEAGNARIPAKATLVFDVELLDIIHPEDKPADDNAADDQSGNQSDK